MPAIARMVAEAASTLAKRQYDYDACYDRGYGYYIGNDGGCYYSGWYGYGRWILLGVVVLVFLLFLASSCLQARRRRSSGKQPMWGTGWMAPPSYNESQQQAGNNIPMNNQATPSYAPPSYPPPAHGEPGGAVYQPPNSPPPRKN